MTVNESRSDNSNGEHAVSRDDEKVKRTKLIMLTVAIMAFIGVLWVLVLPVQMERIRQQFTKSPSHFIAPDAAERESLKEALAEAKEQAAALTEAMKPDVSKANEPVLNTDYLDTQTPEAATDSTLDENVNEELLPTEQP